MSKGISVVICSFNSEKRIKRVLDCLANQENCENIPWEVIMVDNASTDKVVEVARQCWGHPTVPLHIFHEYKQGQSFATRTGFEKASYDVVVTVDDDNYVCSTYISRAFKIMDEHPEVGIAGGRGIGYFDEEPPAWFKEVEQGFAIGPQAEKEGYVSDERGYIYGAGSVIRKPVYDYLMSSDFNQLMRGRIGKSMIAGEDTERCLAFQILGYKLWYDPVMEFYHHMPVKRVNWEYTRKLYNSFGRSFLYFKLYRKIINNKENLYNSFHNNIYLNILKAFIHLSKRLLLSVRIIFFKNSIGKKEILDIDYYIGYISEMIRIRKTYILNNERLTKATWHKTKLLNK